VPAGTRFARSPAGSAGPAEDNMALSNNRGALKPAAEILDERDRHRPLLEVPDPNQDR